MEELKIFNFEENEVRTILINDELHFVGTDVTGILGYRNSSKALIDHVDEEDKLNNESLSSLGQRGGWLINESGLYSLILKSKLPSAKKFKRWVTSEVLPTIRKHGAYLSPQKIEEALMDPDTIIRLALTLKDERVKNERLEQQISEYEPKVNYLDMILSSTDTVTASQIAADCGMSARALNKLLNELGVQRKVSGQWLLYRKHMNQGYTKSHTNEIPKADGGIKVVMNTKWTQKGRLFLYELLKANDYFPQLDLEPQEE